MKICCFGTYEQDYSRNEIIIKLLHEMGHNIQECHISLWKNNKDKSSAFSGISNKLKLIVKLILVYPKLLIKYINIGKHDYIYIGYFGHLDIFFAKLFIILTFRRDKKIIFDAFISLYDSMVFDRKTVREDSLFAKVLYNLDKYACRIADIVLLDTDSHIDYFNKTFLIPADKMVRVFASADTELFYPREKTRQDNKFQILFIGKYIPLHGIEYIVGAANILENDRSMEFIFVGKGQLYSKIRRLAKDKALSNIGFIEWVEYKDLPKIISEADVCLGIFSKSEKCNRVIPNKVFQSIAMGKPLITSRTDGIKEGLTDNHDVILCNPGDSTDLARCIIRLKDDPMLRERIGKNARESFIDKFGNNALKKSLQYGFNKIT